MMRGRPTPDSQPRIGYFTEAAPGATTLRLAAAVVCRGAPRRASLQGGGGLLGWPRSVRHRLWLRFGPLGFDVSVRGRPLFGGEWGAGFSIGSTAGTPDGEPLAYYDDRAHVLRLLGRVLPAPRIETLVALVDATGARAGAPRVVVRHMPMPAMPMPQFAGPPTEYGAMVSYVIGGEQPTWEAALRADPVVRTFLDDDRAL
jgi:hypothetical protein